MKDFLISIATALLLAQTTGAQTYADVPKPDAGRHGGDGAQEAMAELTEVKRLNEEVIKLYGERKFDEALVPATRVLEISRKKLKADPQSVTIALKNLAEIYIAKGKHTEAEVLYGRFLTVYEKALGPRDLNIGYILDSLASLSFSSNEYRKAETLYRRTLLIREKALGPEHPDVAQSLFNLAVVQQAMRNYGRAEPLFQRAIAIREQALGPAHPVVAETVLRYSCLMRSTNRQTEADRLEARANAILFNDAGDKPEPVLLPYDMMKCKSVSKPQPSYPRNAIAERAAGIVNVQVVVDETGKVISARALDGHQLLRQASIEAALKARFAPTLVAGKPVKVTGVISYTFFLS